MKRFLLVLLPLFIFRLSFSQTFSTSSGGPIPDAGAPVSFPITVSGLTPALLDTVHGLETICLNINHPYVGDLQFVIQAPDGTIVNLAIQIGGDGDNYTSTCFNATAANSIVTGTAPFTGTFRPQGILGSINNGQNGNGIWTLWVQDVAAADSGNVVDWSITFGDDPAKPFVFSSSNLPIVVVNTGGRYIPDEPKLGAYMGIIDNGTGVRNHITDPFNNYKDSIGIELRGSSSLGFPQQSYGFETRDINGTQKDTMILGMPQEHDWILYAPYDDKTCMRNVLSYDIANKTGHYASRTRFCELVIDGQYRGIYVVMEKIKRDNNRVHIAKLTPTDISGDDLTGGYIIKTDRDDGPGSYWISSYPSATGYPVPFVYVYPKTEDLVPQQKEYIKSYVDSLENALNGPDFADSTLGYRKYLGVNSFIDYFILNEISKNVDGYRLSTFFYKDKQSNGGKLKAGPAWDYNLAWWNADYCEGSVVSGWAYKFPYVCGGDGYQLPFWWEKLLQDPSYTSQLKCRWNELRQTTLSIAVLDNYVDSLSTLLDEAQERHFTVWPILGTYTWPNPSPIPIDYAGEITALKTWIHDRILWMDDSIPGICTVGINEAAMSENNLTVYPNPFNNSIKMDFYLTHSDKLKIDVIDVLGETVKTIEQKEFPGGDNSFEITFTNGELKNGVYFLKINTTMGSIVKRITKVE